MDPTHVPEGWSALVLPSGLQALEVKRTGNTIQQHTQRLASLVCITFAVCRVIYTLYGARRGCIASKPSYPPPHNVETPLKCPWRGTAALVRGDIHHLMRMLPDGEGCSRSWHKTLRHACVARLRASSNDAFKFRSMIRHLPRLDRDVQRNSETRTPRYEGWGVPGWSHGCWRRFGPPRRRSAPPAVNLACAPACPDCPSTPSPSSRARAPGPTPKELGLVQGGGAARGSAYSHRASGSSQRVQGAVEGQAHPMLMREGHRLGHRAQRDAVACRFVANGLPQRCNEPRSQEQDQDVVFQKASACRFAREMFSHESENHWCFPSSSY